MKTLQSRDNLIWIDLEMTGLDPDKEKIIETLEEPLRNEASVLNYVMAKSIKEKVLFT